MPTSIDFLPFILRGAVVTVQLAVIGSFLAIIIAFVAGISRLSRSYIISGAAVIFVECFRGTSIYVQLFWVYFVLPIFGIAVSSFLGGVLVLGLNSGAYMSEIVRGSFLGLPREQLEACVALNLGRWQRLWYILLPQALQTMIPPMSNSVVELLKATSILSLISVSDMTFRAQSVRAQTGESAVPFLVIIVLYYVLAHGIWKLIQLLERRFVPPSIRSR
ncbi:ectoine/hydroxyectoine ABC transporter permease subunit EhuC [Mesorhizobium sp. M1060]|uniref:ectoine/hydroxyectoine ABC transporter permease subunit EhuC n=1 Tax=Mesorhizobium sp. M1060 TaxID=2957052 RepID=UPI003337F972